MGGDGSGGNQNIKGGQGSPAQELITEGGAYSGSGGVSYWGGGGEGVLRLSGEINGRSGKAYGSGGGGGASTTTTDTTGGAGKEGYIQIMEYYTNG